MASVESNIRRLDLQIQLFESQLGSIVDEVTAILERDISNDEIDPDVVAVKAGSISSLLNAAGLKEFVAKIAQNYGAIIREVQSAFNSLNIDFEFTEKDERDLTTVIQVDMQAINQATSRYVANLGSRLVRASISGEAIPFASIFEQTKSSYIRDVITILENALQGIRNAFFVRKGKEKGIEKFLYSGPRDQKNREFCAARVGKVYSLEELNKMDNGQGLPVLTNAGGWNCRHEIRPVKN